MTGLRFAAFLAALFTLAVVAYLTSTPPSGELAVTGVVSGPEVIVSPKISGRIERLLVDEGSEVKLGQRIAQLDRAELEAQLRAAEANIRSLEARSQQAEKTLTWTDDQTLAALHRAEATLTATKAQLEEARADLWRSEVDYQRAAGLYEGGVASAQDRDRADATLRVARAHVKSLEDQVQAQQAELEVARANRRQLEVQQSELAAAQAQLEQARAAKAEAETRLGYTEIVAPLGGIVSVRAARQGEVVQPGAPIVTIVDVDHLWVRADIEESFVDSLQYGDRLKVRLPSGKILEGELFFKGVESEFATQRDVSRTKRDIKAFTIKVAVPNEGRRIFLGMTAEVLLAQPAPKLRGARSWFARLWQRFR